MFNNKIDLIIFGWAIGMLIAVILVFHCVPVYSDDIKNCQSICQPNNGIDKIYIAGGCKCKNGAEFSKGEAAQDRLPEQIEE